MTNWYVKNDISAKLSSKLLLMEKKEEVKIFKKSFISKQENIQDSYVIDAKVCYLNNMLQALGSGQNGVVKKIIHKGTKQERAVKIISKAKIKNVDRFKSEVDILRSVVN